MIRAFFDESSDGATFLLGGWVADDEHWESFAKDWEKGLRTEPTIEYFSHHEAKAAKGQFSGWLVQQIESKTQSLVDIICQHEMYGIVTGLNLSRHASVFKGSLLAPKQLRTIMKLTHPYQWCFFSGTAAVLQAQLERGTTQDKVDFIFDEQSGLFDECAAFYTEFRQQMPSDKLAIAGAVTQSDDKTVGPLQAADLLVGQMTTNLRFGKPEAHWRRMATCHQIMAVKAYPPAFETIPDLVSAVNIAWSTKRLGSITGRRDSSS
jgi:hypothetical protein